MNNKQEPGILFGLLFQGFWIAFQMIFVCVGRQLQKQELYWIGLFFVGIGILIFILSVIKPIISFIITLIAAQILIAAQKKQSDIEQTFSTVNKTDYNDYNNYNNPYDAGNGSYKMNQGNQNSNNNSYGNYGDGSKYR